MVSNFGALSSFMRSSHRDSLGGILGQMHQQTTYTWFPPWFGWRESLGYEASLNKKIIGPSLRQVTKNSN